MCWTHPHKKGQNTKYPSARASYGGDNKHIMFSTNLGTSIVYLTPIVVY
jgi:hypothetical protein